MRTGQQGVHLPSGAHLRVSFDRAREVAGPPDAPPFVRVRKVLEAPGVLTDARGGAVDVGSLALADAHVLRAVLAWARIFDEPEIVFDCENCGAPFALAAAHLFEPGPFFDGELADPDLDAPFDFAAEHPLARTGVATARAPTVRLAPRTVAEAEALWRLDPEGPFEPTAAVVAALGVVSFGRTRRAPAIAERLARCSDALFAAFVEVWNDAHYPPRLVAVHRCAGCGARNDVDVPGVRELARSGPGPVGRGGGRAREAFPDLDAFEAKVRTIAEKVFVARGVRHVGLFIDADVPAVDDGGEPLLGSYVPRGVDELGVEREAEVRLYYRTFRAEFADALEELEPEIRETLDHELQHHLHHLAGADPLDDEEHEAIDAEAIRRVGRAETRRRVRRGVVSELVGFVRVTGPIWLVVGLALTLSWWGPCAPR